jgi:prepilin signal peptidase PulO-like enzyme (type II secretory pathway)
MDNVQITAALILVAKYAGAVIAGVFLGNGAVYFFNKMPAKWLTDYGEEPSEELRDPYTQRIKSWPWKYVLTGVFIVVDVYLVWQDWRYAVPAAAALWLLLEIAISDKKYMIIPDQLTILLMVTGFGFLQFAGGWKSMAAGAALGFGLMGMAALLGRLFYGETVMGGGDIKLFAAIGFISGFYGMIIIFILTTVIGAGHACWLLARKKVKKKEFLPMAPYIAAASWIYMIFLSGRSELLIRTLL